jgi:ABC-type multidrug transport system permease subunit
MPQQLGLFFFSFHLFVLGYLVFKSGYLPRILGVLLIVSSFGYLLDSFALTLLPNYADYEEIIILVIFLPNLIGEMALALWLLFKGVNVEQWEKRALESA